MPDDIANFPLRGAKRKELALALGRCASEFLAAHGRAMIVANFLQDVRVEKARDALAEQFHQDLGLCRDMGLIFDTPSKTKSDREIARLLVEHAYSTANDGWKTAVMTMLHDAFKRYLWRLVRFGLVASREKAICLLKDENRKITEKDLRRAGSADAALDLRIEKKWKKLGKCPLEKRWQVLEDLVGLPQRLYSPPTWRFDIEMLTRFNEVRNDAVHGRPQAVRDYDVAAFARQLWRAQLVWMAHVATLLQVKVPGEVLYLGSGARET